MYRLMRLYHIPLRMKPKEYTCKFTKMWVTNHAITCLIYHIALIVSKITCFVKVVAMAIRHNMHNFTKSHLINSPNRTKAVNSNRSPPSIIPIWLVTLSKASVTPSAMNWPPASRLSLTVNIKWYLKTV